MKKNTTGLMIFLSIVISLVLPACKKESRVLKTNCKIVEILAGTNATSFNYNTDGKLSSKNAVTTDTYIYNGNKINITNSTGTTINFTTLVTLNASGQATDVTMFDKSGTLSSNTVYDYNGTEVSKSTSVSAGSVPNIVTYNWGGGNLLSFQNGPDTTKFDYALDKPAHTGDLWDLENLIQGFETIKTKNLVRSYSNALNTTTLIYSFDADEKITGLSAIGNGVIVGPFSYQYECN